MQTRAKQQGITFFSLALMMVIGGFFILIALKTGPLYLENYTIQSSLDELKNDPAVGEMSPVKIRATISKQLYINDIRRFSERDIQIKRGGGIIRVFVEYEVREHLLANVDIILSFANAVEVPMR
jgi:hypothetical protein